MMGDRKERLTSFGYGQEPIPLLSPTGRGREPEECHLCGEPAGEGDPLVYAGPERDRGEERDGRWIHLSCRGK